MAIAKDSGRQEVIHADIPFTFATLGATAVAIEAIDLPVGAEIIGGDLIVDTAFDTGTTATFKFGDALDDDRYTASAIDLKTAARTALTVTGYRALATSNKLKILPTYVGTAATAGAGRVRIQYIVDGRAAFSQG